MMGGFGSCCGGWIGGGWGFGWLGILLNAFILIGVVALVVWLVRRLSASVPGSRFSSTPAPDQRSPKELLAVRYASGEIDSDQYKRMLSDLE